MASRFYGINRGGQQPKDVTESSSTTSSAVELQVDLSKVTDKLAVVLMIEVLQNYLQTTETNPIA